MGFCICHVIQKSFLDYNLEIFILLQLKTKALGLVLPEKRTRNLVLVRDYSTNIHYSTYTLSSIVVYIHYSTAKISYTFVFNIIYTYICK